MPAIEQTAREAIEHEVTQYLHLRAVGAEGATQLLQALASRWSEQSQVLVHGARKGAVGLKAAFKKHAPQENHPTKAQLREFGALADAFARGLSDMSSRRRIIEARIEWAESRHVWPDGGRASPRFGTPRRLACHLRALLMWILQMKLATNTALKRSRTPRLCLAVRAA